MKKVLGVYISLALILLVSACSSQLTTVNLVKNDESQTETDQEQNQEQDIEEVTYKEIIFESIQASVLEREVELTISLVNEDNLTINSIELNDEIFTEFESNLENTEIKIKINEGMYVGDKSYELQALSYGNDEISFNTVIEENNYVEVIFTLNINNYKFLQIPQYPMDYVRLTSSFRSQSYYNIYGVKHNGIDMGGVNGGYGDDGIYSIADGEVVYFNYSSTAGKYVVIKHENLIENQTVITRYLHLNNYEDFTIGEKIKKGQLVGIEGETGKVNGAHLHFEMWITPAGYDYQFMDISYYAVDPVIYLYVHNYQELSDRSLEQEYIHNMN